MESQQRIIIFSSSEVGWLFAHGVEPIKTSYMRSGRNVERLAYIYDATPRFCRLHREFHEPKNAATHDFLVRFAIGICRRERQIRFRKGEGAAR